MIDKNGKEIRTGCIVEITGSYFKNYNGLYFVAYSPDDPNWTGSDHSLKKISKAGKISKTKYNTCFWPISVYVNDRSKRDEANRWNREHAQIEIKSISNMQEVLEHFQKCSKETEKYIFDARYNYGDDSPYAAKYQAIKDHYDNVVHFIENGTVQEVKSDD